MFSVENNENKIRSTWRVVPQVWVCVTAANKFTAIRFWFDCVRWCMTTNNSHSAIKQWHRNLLSAVESIYVPLVRILKFINLAKVSLIPFDAIRELSWSAITRNLTSSASYMRGMATAKLLLWNTFMQCISAWYVVIDYDTVEMWVCNYVLVPKFRSNWNWNRFDVIRKYISSQILFAAPLYPQMLLRQSTHHLDDSHLHTHSQGPYIRNVQ